MIFHGPHGLVYGYFLNKVLYIIIIFSPHQTSTLHGSHKHQTVRPSTQTNTFLSSADSINVNKRTKSGRRDVNPHRCCSFYNTFTRTPQLLKKAKNGWYFAFIFSLSPFFSIPFNTRRVGLPVALRHACFLQQLLIFLHSYSFFLNFILSPVSIHLPPTHKQQHQYHHLIILSSSFLPSFTSTIQLLFRLRLFLNASLRL